MKPGDPRGILVIATRQIGDVLLTTPMIRRAQALWPDAKIDVLGFSDTLGMLEGNPDVNRLIAMPPRGGLPALVRFVRKERLWRRYDLALVTQPSDRAHLLGFIAAPTRAGIVSPDLKTSWWKRMLLVRHVVLAGDRGSTHVVDEKLALLDPWAAAQQAGAPADIVFTPPTSLPGHVLSLLRPRFAVVHVASMWRYKQWPLEHFARLVSTLSDNGIQVVLTGGPSDQDRRMTAEVQAAAGGPNVVDMAGTLGFGQLTAMLQRASLYVGPDTSVTHLAAAVGTPTIALFGPTNPARWGPRAPRIHAGDGTEPSAGVRPAGVVVMQGPGDCVPCGRAGCEDHRDSRSLCLEGVRPERVATVALSMLARRSDDGSAPIGQAATRPD